jgi:hypothetical protein
MGCLQLCMLSLQLAGRRMDFAEQAKEHAIVIGGRMCTYIKI